MTRQRDDRLPLADGRRRIQQVGPGEKLGRWELVRLLGQGATGFVFAGRDGSGEEAAIKVLRPEATANPKTLARFRREAKILQAVVHRNVVRLLDTGELDDLFFLVLELVEGPSLDKRLAKGRFEPDAALELACDLFRGLDAVHAQ